MKPPPAIAASGLTKVFRRKGGDAPLTALDGVSLCVAAGSLTCMVGPDGAGKTTFLRLAAGLMPATSGALQVLGIDVARKPQAVQDRISYMPQRFGLYEDLSVQENLDLYADLHGVGREQRRQRYARLMEMTDLGRFTGRLAGKLSGGMKQKLGLACTLVRSPALLLLDEPTAGVDPLSRRELWQIVHQLVEQDGLAVLVTTAYLDEAESSAQVIVLDRGRVLADGAPSALRRLAADRVCLAPAPPDVAPRVLQSALMARADVVDAVPQAGQVRVVLAEGVSPASLPQLQQAQAVAARIEDGFMVALRRSGRRDGGAAQPPSASVAGAGARQDSNPVIEVRDLAKKFGDFTAVENTTFSVSRGEIFGLLGPNGAGKTTTFRMLCGLLAPSAGSLRVAGVDLKTAPARARQRVGYVSQAFALYRNLTVRENLQFFASAYGLRGAAGAARYRSAIEDFGLQDVEDRASGDLPGGFRQRLAMAAALLHQPEILFLDEPTSGADPLARREFWRRITALAQAGVTVIVTTHFMEEAEYCDRILIQDAGRVLALGAPREVRRQAAPDDPHLSMEQAFIAIVEHSREAGARESLR